MSNPISTRLALGNSGRIVRYHFTTFLYCGTTRHDIFPVEAQKSTIKLHSFRPHMQSVTSLALVVPIFLRMIVSNISSRIISRVYDRIGIFFSSIDSVRCIAIASGNSNLYGAIIFPYLARRWHLEIIISIYLTNMLAPQEFKFDFIFNIYFQDMSDNRGTFGSSI